MLALSDTFMLHYFKRFKFNLREFFKAFLRLKRQSDKISTVLTENMLLKPSVIISVALGNSRGKRAKRFRIRTSVALLYRYISL